MNQILMDVKDLVTVSTSPKRRILKAPTLNLLTVSIVGGLFGLIITDGQVFQWKIGVVIWTISLILLMSTLLGWPFVLRRASLFYVWEQFVRIPTSIVFLLIGFELALQPLGFLNKAILLGGFAIGFFLLPNRVTKWRRRLEKAVDSGYLRTSLNISERTWSLENDNYPALSDPTVTNPGPWRRLMLWIGPAIGVTAVNILGGPTALLLTGIAFIGLGYWLLFNQLETGAACWLFLSDLEAEVGPLRVIGAD